MGKYFLLVATLISTYGIIYGQVADASPDSIDNSDRQYAPKVYIDCGWCYQDYLKTELSFVNFVRDRQDADIDLVVTTQETGSGGTEYNLDFIGQKEYSDISFDLKYTTSSTNTEDERREGFIHTFKMGLMPFLSRTPLSKLINIDYLEESSPEDVKDKWNFWVFKFSMGGNINGQVSTKDIGIWGSASVSRTTLQNKFDIEYWVNYNESRFDYEDIVTTSILRSQGLDESYVYSLSDHWSIGEDVGASTSIYNNTRLQLYVEPQIEFNIFPYDEFTKRSLILRYGLALEHFDYFERTIYDKTSEYLFSEELRFFLSMIRKWGSVNVGVRGSNYLHDFSKNRLSISGNLSLNIIGGLSLNVNSSYAFIHNQLSLPMGTASEEDVYLRRQQLETNYSYYGYIGMSYTFGSIYTNIVNPRL